MWCDFNLLPSFRQLVESKKVNPSVSVSWLWNHVQLWSRRCCITFETLAGEGGILGAGAFGITRGSFDVFAAFSRNGLLWRFLLLWEGVHRVATWFRAWFRLCAGESLSSCLSPYCCWPGPFVSSLSPLCLLSSVIQLLWLCPILLALSPFVCLHICFPALLAGKAALVWPASLHLSCSFVVWCLVSRTFGHLCFRLWFPILYMYLRPGLGGFFSDFDDFYLPLCVCLPV